MAKVEPLDCTLEFSRKGLVRVGGAWKTDQKRRTNLPAEPIGYTRLRGPYGQIAQHANKLNALQERTGFIDFLFAPEPATDKKEDKQ